MKPAEMKDEELAKELAQFKTRIKDAESGIVEMKRVREALSKELRKRKLLKAHGLE